MKSKACYDLNLLLNLYLLWLIYGKTNEAFKSTNLISMNFNAVSELRIIERVSYFVEDQCVGKWILGFVGSDKIDPTFHMVAVLKIFDVVDLESSDKAFRKDCGIRLIGDRSNFFEHLWCGSGRWCWHSQTETNCMNIMPIRNIRIALTIIVKDF